MKRAVLVVVLLVSAGSVFLQTLSRPNLASMMPAGAMLYLEAADFGRLLRDWDTSKVKADWLLSDNYAVFSRSNLFNKLDGVYKEYGRAAAFLPDLRSVTELAGTESALALYQIRDIELLYLSRVGQAQLAQSQLWAVRSKFEQRQAGGVSFYLRIDPASKRTVAFALAKGYLLLATRDDLVARALALMAGGRDPSIASEPWYHDSTAARPRPGDLRLVMNLESLVKSVYFRSYWIQRNASTVRQYWAGAADVSRSKANITETRVLLRRPEAGEQTGGPGGTDALSGLIALVPPEAGLYKVSRGQSSSDAAALAVQKLIAAQPQQTRDRRYAPGAISPDERAGSETDLETRIDELPLPSDGGLSESIDAIRPMVEKTGVKALLLVQSSLPVGGTFIRTPSVIVLAGSTDWDPNSVRTGLASAAGWLWTISRLGAGWVPGTAGRHSIERLDGLGTLMFTVHGPLLFLGNDPRLLATVLDRIGTKPANAALTYAAGFRHLREHSNYERVMMALDFTAPAGNMGFGLVGNPGGAPPFFSKNLGSLSRVLSRIGEVNVTEEDRGRNVVQTIIYRLPTNPD
jgi:hypothetical protein